MRPAHTATYPKRALGSLWLLCLFAGCGYGEISPTAYSHALALYGITNRRAESHLDAMQERVFAAVTAQQITTREGAWLQGILSQARRGNWQSANQSARAMLRDQVRSATTSPSTPPTSSSPLTL